MFCQPLPTSLAWLYIANTWSKNLDERDCMGEQQLGCYAGVKQVFDVGYCCVSVIGHGNSMEGVSCMLVDVLELAFGWPWQRGRAWEKAVSVSM